VDDDRNPPPAKHPTAGSEVGGQRDVTAEADDHVGRDVVEHRTRLPDGPAHPQWQPDQVTRRLARQRYRSDEFEVVSALGHQSCLQPTLRAQRGDPDPRIECHQRVGDGHRWLHVTGGASTCENHGYPAVASLLPRRSGNGRVVHP
jgi:hypothetical protein